jgi:hypothetical protein
MENKTILFWDLETTELVDFKNLKNKGLENYYPSVICTKLFNENGEFIEDKSFLFIDKNRDDITFLKSIIKVFVDADINIAFNSNNFDWHIMRNIFHKTIIEGLRKKSIDPMEVVIKDTGHRASLADLCLWNTNYKKNGNGQAAPELFKNKNYKELIEYCFNDVFILSELWFRPHSYPILVKSSFYGNENKLCHFREDVKEEIDHK